MAKKNVGYGIKKEDISTKKISLFLNVYTTEHYYVCMWRLKHNSVP